MAEKSDKQLKIRVIDYWKELVCCQLKSGCLTKTFPLTKIFVFFSLFYSFSSWRDLDKEEIWIAVFILLSCL